MRSASAARLPSLHHRKEGWLRHQENVAKPPQRTQPGWFSFCIHRKTTPASRSAEASRYLLDRSATPPCGDARRGVACDTKGTSMTSGPLSAEELRKMNDYWRAANYLSVGQIYLYANPLMREPLKLDHVKPRLLGHWGTTPGLNFIYVHLNRIIKMRDLNMIYICGPG